MAFGAMYNTIGDFLVNEIPDGNDFPDNIFFSNGTDTDVSLAKNAWVDGPVTILDTMVHLTVKPNIPGWNYTKINDPGAGLYRIASVTRNDGQVIPLENMWLTYCTIPDVADPIYEDKLHFTDLFASFDKVGYNIVFVPVDHDISGNFGKEGKMVGWIQASSVPAISQFIGLPVVPGPPIDTLLVLYNMPIYDTTFTIDDLKLIKNQNDTLSVATLNITPGDPDHLLFRIIGLEQVAAGDGNYRLVVLVTSIYGRNGEHGLTDQSVAWSVCQIVPPTAFAGSNDTTCSNINYPLSGNVTNASTSTWSTSGSGTFYNSGSLSPTYQPSTADISAGAVIITLTAFASNNCSAPARSSLRLVIVKAPYAYAGSNVTMITGEAYTLSNSIAQNTSSVNWTTSGSGQFSNNQILHPVYTPSVADTSTITMTLSVAGYHSCETVASALTINYLPPASPAIQASNLVFSNPDTAKVTLNWTDGNGMKRSVFMKLDTIGSPVPEMTGNYVGNSLFGAGSQIGASGWFCVFNGTTHPQGVVVTGLLPGMTHRLMVCDYNEYTGMRYYQQQSAVQNPVYRPVCPVTIPQISGNTTGCAGIALSFSTETGMNDYSWTVLPDGLINSGSGTSSVMAIWNDSGSKTLKVN